MMAGICSGPPETWDWSDNVGQAHAHPTPPDGSDAGDLDTLGPGAARFLGQAAHVLDVAGEQHDRPRLGQRHHREQRVHGASVAGQTGPPEQFAGRAALLGPDRHHGDVGQDPVHGRVPPAAPQHLSQGRRRGDDAGLRSVGAARQGYGQRVASRELRQAVGVQDQRPAY